MIDAEEMQLAREAALLLPLRVVEIRPILRLADVTEILNLGRQTIYNRSNARSRYFDPRFPKRFPLGKGARAVGWFADEIAAYQNELSAERVD